MAEHRQPYYRIAIKGPEGRRVGELYPASLFPGGAGLDDLYRVRVDRVWYAPGGEKYAFFQLADALAVAGWPRREEARPNLAKGSRRRLSLGTVDGEPLYESVVCMTDPFQGPDGRWRVFLVSRREPVLCDGLER